jgi:chromosome segregation ATPase
MKFASVALAVSTCTFFLQKVACENTSTEAELVSQVTAYTERDPEFLKAWVSKVQLQMKKEQSMRLAAETRANDMQKRLHDLTTSLHEKEQEIKRKCQTDRTEKAEKERLAAKVKKLELSLSSLNEQLSQAREAMKIAQGALSAEKENAKMFRDRQIGSVSHCEEMMSDVHKIF